jgi:hypothetical protein
MNTLMISYDLIAPGRGYEALRNFIESPYSKWAKPVESLYLIKTNKTAEAYRNELQSYLDTNDKVIVIDVTGKEAAWKGLPDTVSNWIKSNL